MATVTLGTAAQTTLTALKFLHGYNSGMSAADIAAISQTIKDDTSFNGVAAQQAFSANGLLYIPRRGVLTMRAGDYVGVDSTGWPVLLSSKAAASASWVHT